MPKASRTTVFAITVTLGVVFHSTLNELINWLDLDPFLGLPILSHVLKILVKFSLDVISGSTRRKLVDMAESWILILLQNVRPKSPKEFRTNLGKDVGTVAS
jgi:hypothetical protein